ncbi:DUF3592 domain-containing protein [Methylocystis sp. SC2]|uniref:DUF3592 domain-containing protein n=1 Tax=Methylocystis sp. (strain SC2) TaxID=187303 RepID=UPI0011D17D70|nr:DUF3592 domain-containing protein [Methylocystis sp. SC2]
MKDFIVIFVLCIIALPILKRWVYFRRSVMVKGTVVDFRPVYTDDGRMWCPNIEYVGLDGEKKIFESGTGATYRMWKIGETVDVALDPVRDSAPEVYSIGFELIIGSIFLFILLAAVYDALK